MGNTKSSENKQKFYNVFHKEKIVLKQYGQIGNINSDLTDIYSLQKNKYNSRSYYCFENEIDFSEENIDGYLYMIQGDMDNIKIFNEKLDDKHSNSIMGYKLKLIPKKCQSNIQKIVMKRELLYKQDESVKHFILKEIKKNISYFVIELKENVEEYKPIKGIDIEHAFSSNWKDKINDMDATTNPNTSLESIKNKYSKYYMMHATNFAKETIINGSLCVYGDCTTKFYDEKTGMYLFPKKKKAQVDDGGVPGIYMELFEYGTTQPLQMKDEIIFTSINTFYGNVGFIFPFSKVFEYYVDLKLDQDFGHSKNVSIDSYVNHRNGSEALIRANKIPIKHASSIFVMFNNYERFYISDKLFTKKKVPTLKDLINLYRKNKDNKWYIRKSNLLKLLEIYDRFSIKIPSMYCVSDTNWGYVEDSYNTPLDINSDDDV